MQDRMLLTPLISTGMMCVPNAANHRIRLPQLNCQPITDGQTYDPLKYISYKQFFQPGNELKPCLYSNTFENRARNLVTGATYHQNLSAHVLFKEPKPSDSYIGLIAKAILNSPDCRMVLSDIYQSVIDTHPYFRIRGPGWKNSIRHNLSLNDCFIKAGRCSSGKGHYWTVHPANKDDFMKGDFRRRRAQQRVENYKQLLNKKTTPYTHSSEDEYPPSMECNNTDSPSPNVTTSNSHSTVPKSPRRPFDIDSLLSNN